MDNDIEVCHWILWWNHKSASSYIDWMRYYEYLRREVVWSNKISFSSPGIDRYHTADLRPDSDLTFNRPRFTRSPSCFGANHRTKNSPYAQRMTLGWVIVGETCLNQFHRPDCVNYPMRSDKMSICKPCPNNFDVKEKWYICDEQRRQ